jgi:hypothetical protein
MNMFFEQWDAWRQQSSEYASRSTAMMLEGFMALCRRQLDWAGQVYLDGTREFFEFYASRADLGDAAGNWPTLVNKQAEKSQQISRSYLENWTEAQENAAKAMEEMMTVWCKPMLETAQQVAKTFAQVESETRAPSQSRHAVEAVEPRIRKHAA